MPEIGQLGPASAERGRRDFCTRPGLRPEVTQSPFLFSLFCSHTARGFPRPARESARAGPTGPTARGEVTNAGGGLAIPIELAGAAESSGFRARRPGEVQRLANVAVNG